MNQYLVSYDLNRPGQGYKELWQELEALGAKRVLLSQWILRSELSASDLRDDLKRLIDANDRLLVVKLGTWASWNTLLRIRDF